MNGITLVVLAAGMGSRYGGVKQIDGIGADGETLLDYAVYDALRSGFTDVVFLIRSGIEADFRSTVLARMGAKVKYELAFQELGSLVPESAMATARAAGRTKPWGTAHAVLCAGPKLRNPFAVINADDFYGREAFAAMAAFLGKPDPAGAVPTASLVPYKLAPSLSPSGTVARGVCAISGGFLSDVVEHTGIERRGSAIVAEHPTKGRVELKDDTPVSMNFWGFRLSALEGIRAHFDAFLAKSAGNPKAEAYLPAAVDEMIKAGTVKAVALEADSEWFGMTYKEDRAAAAERIKQLVAEGRYPAALWR